jgi:FKBP-type peptidyl-prolyl cis-trans isomerase FklB
MCVNNYFQEKNAVKQAEEEKLNEKYKILGENFLKENVRNLGVVVTESGLQYKIIGETDGPKPSATSKVKVHYHGTTIEGKVFDSSVDRGEPIEFPLNQVIPGWTEGLQLMSVGSKFKFFIPQNLAYGAQSPSPAIAPYSTLIFEVELLSFEDTPKN